MTKEQFEIDPDTIRSKEQYEQTKKAAGAGCAWCLPDEEQKSPVLFSNELVTVRKNVFAKEGRDMYIIHLNRHASMDDIKPEEAFAIFEARQDLASEMPGGAFIHRFGEKKYHASSLPTDHYFESVVVPHGNQPVAETLCKDKSAEKTKERKERSKTFF